MSNLRTGGRRRSTFWSKTTTPCDRGMSYRHLNIYPTRKKYFRPLRTIPLRYFIFGWIHEGGARVDSFCSIFLCFQIPVSIFIGNIYWPWSLTLSQPWWTQTRKINDWPKRLYPSSQFRDPLVSEFYCPKDRYPTSSLTFLSRTLSCPNRPWTLFTLRPRQRGLTGNQEQVTESSLDPRIDTQLLNWL